jgi:hypothetical protein
MRLLLRSNRLPGRSCGPYRDVHVGVQVGSSPADLVPGDAAEATWTVDLDVVDTAAGTDFTGPAVHGPRGERFLYLTWGTYDGSKFEMLRRAKIMLSDSGISPATSQAVATVDLIDESGMPRCARVRPPAISWEVQDASA